MTSLRAKLIVGTGVTTVLLVGLASVASYYLVRAALYAEFDQLLESKARSLSVLVEQERDGIEVEFAEHPLREFERKDDPEFFQLWTADGTVLSRSGSLNGGNLERLSLNGRDSTIQSVELPDGRAGRIVCISFYPTREKGAVGASGPLSLAVARSTATIDATLARLFGILVAVAGTTTLLILGGMVWVVHRSLKPVARLARDIGAIDEDRLATRIERGKTPDELMTVVNRLNVLLERLDAAFDRERSFTADAAHELRTPLTGLRTTLEVALSRRRDSAAYRESMQSCLGICCKTQRVVETLLSIARFDRGRTTSPTDDVSLVGLLRDCWEPLMDRAADRELKVDWNVQDSLHVRTDAGMLGIIIANLLENSVVHAPIGSDICLATSSHDGVVSLTVTNDDNQLKPKDVQRVFDRFWRGDAAHSDVGIHAGLGLPLCKSLANSLGCLISAEKQNGSFSIQLQFPEESAFWQPVTSTDAVVLSR